jgi:hypothetical protein
MLGGVPVGGTGVSSVLRSRRWLQVTPSSSVIRLIQRGMEAPRGGH